MKIRELIELCAVDNDFEIDLYDEENQINESATFGNLWNDNTDYSWLDAEIEYWNPDTQGHYIQISAILKNIE